MNIRVNGEQREMPEDCTVFELIEEIGLHPNAAVVEHNRQALLRKEFETTKLQDGDQLEVFRISAGG